MSSIGPGEPARLPAGLQHKLFENYVPLTGSYDELFEAPGRPRAHAAGVLRNLDMLSAEGFAQRQSLAELSLFNQGVTFSVYSDKRGTEKIFPFCLVPRVIAADRLGPGRARAGPAHARAVCCSSTTSTAISASSPPA